MQCVADCNTSHPRNFEQPVLQTLQMFVGESGCWLVVLLTFLLRRSKTNKAESPHSEVGYSRLSTQDSEEALPTSEEGSETIVGDLSESQLLVDPTNIVAKPIAEPARIVAERRPLSGWRVTILALPAICDIIATTLMNAGLLFVAASIYQMTRGALVLFVGLFSVVFLKRHLGFWKWASLFVVVAGVAIVGLAGVIDKQEDGRLEPDLPGSDPGKDSLVHNILLLTRAEAPTAAQTALGIFMIAGAQIFTASQFVLEESIMSTYSMDPIRVVGWEGIFGFSVTLIGMWVLHVVIGTGYFDAVEAFREVFGNRTIGMTSLLIMISIG